MEELEDEATPDEDVVEEVADETPLEDVLLFAFEDEELLETDELEHQSSKADTAMAGGSP